MKRKLNSDSKNEIIENIITKIVTKDFFLVLGHQNPDEDCLASMVAISLLLSKFNKKTSIYVHGDIHDNFTYLLNICRYNAIYVFSGEKPESLFVENIIVCDTPKPSMIDATDEIIDLIKNNSVPLIEIDHHTGGDSEYIGHNGYALVDEASSACELIGEIAISLSHKKELLERNSISEIFTRNIVLALLTGIIGDSNMGKYFKSDKEKKNYLFFSSLYNEILQTETTSDSNLSNMDEIFSEIKRLNQDEEACFNYLMSRKKKSDSVFYVIADQPASRFLFEQYDYDTVVSVSRSIADILAEESKMLGLVVYYDKPEIKNLVQFKLRRSQYYRKFDLRNSLDILSITDGGGHEGAIGFRVPVSDIEDVDKYTRTIMKKLERYLH